VNRIRQDAPLDYRRGAAERTAETRVAPSSVVPCDRKDVNEHSPPRINHSPIQAFAGVIDKPEPPRDGLTTVSAQAEGLRIP
jgi:hypothetical protein